MSTFISYSRRQLYLAESLALHLQQQGIDVWFDLRRRNVIIVSTWGFVIVGLAVTWMFNLTVPLWGYAIMGAIVLALLYT